jgi:hypothetical protein
MERSGIIMTDYLFKHVTTDDPDLKYFSERLLMGLGMELGWLMITWTEIEKIQ